MIRNLHPFKDLSGKLDHLRMRQPQILNIYQLLNSFKPSTSPTNLIDKMSIEQISELSPSHSPLSYKQFSQLQFDVHAYSNPEYPIPTTTIYQPLPPSQANITRVLKRYISQLNTRQTLYLNYRLRAMLDGIYPSWNNLHLNRQSPYKNDIIMLPLLSRVMMMQQLKKVDKAKLTTMVLETIQQRKQTIMASTKQHLQNK